MTCKRFPSGCRRRRGQQRARTTAVRDRSSVNGDTAARAYSCWTCVPTGQRCSGTSKARSSPWVSAAGPAGLCTGPVPSRIGGRSCMDDLVTAVGPRCCRWRRWGAAAKRVKCSSPHGLGVAGPQSVSCWRLSAEDPGDEVEAARERAMRCGMRNVPVPGRALAWRPAVIGARLICSGFAAPGSEPARPGPAGGSIPRDRLWVPRKGA